MTYPLGLNKEVLLAKTVYTVLFPNNTNPFSPYITPKNTLTGDVHKIEAILLANYQTMQTEIFKRQSNLSLEKNLSTTDAGLKTRLNSLINNSDTAIFAMLPNAESLRFSYKLWEVNNTLMNGGAPNADDVKWLKTHWNFLNNCNKYNLNTAAVDLTVLGIIGLSVVAAFAIGISASLFLAPVMTIVVANALALALIAMATLTALSTLYMANTLLFAPQKQSFAQKFKFPFFHNNGEERSHVCIVPGATSALSFFAPTTSQRLNKAAIDKLDDALPPSTPA